MKNQDNGKLPGGILIATLLVFLAMAPNKQVDAQCVDDPSGKTAVKLSNHTQYDLMFGIDDEDKGTVEPGKESPEWEVKPGIHLLIAGAIIDGRASWVWTENEVPKGQVCTLNIEGPKEDSANNENAHSRNTWFSKHFTSKKPIRRKIQCQQIKVSKTVVHEICALTASPPG